MSVAHILALAFPSRSDLRDCQASVNEARAVAILGDVTFQYVFCYAPVDGCSHECRCSVQCGCSRSACEARMSSETVN